MTAIFLDSSFYIALVNPRDKHAARAKKVLKDLFSGKYKQAYTSSFVMSETGTAIGSRNPEEPSNYIVRIKELFIGENKLAAILPSDNEIESSTWEFMIKVNRNTKNRKDLVSWVDCSNIIFCKRFKINYIAAFDHHFDPYLRRIH